MLETTVENKSVKKRIKHSSQQEIHPLSSKAREELVKRCIHVYRFSPAWQNLETNESK